MQMLSINCRKCGANNKFPDNQIPSFCEFCGAALPDMSPFVEEAIRIQQARQYHEMNMERADKEYRKAQLKTSVETMNAKNKRTGEIIRGIIAVSAFLAIAIVFIVGMIAIMRLRK